MDELFKKIENMVVDNFGTEFMDMLCERTPHNKNFLSSSFSYKELSFIKESLTKKIDGDIYDLSGTGTITELLDGNNYPQYSVIINGIEDKATSLLSSINTKIDDAKNSLNNNIHSNVEKVIHYSKNTHAEEVSESMRTHQPTNKEAVVAMFHQIYGNKYDQTVEKQKVSNTLTEMEAFLSKIQDPSLFVDQVVL